MLRKTGLIAALAFLASAAPAAAYVGPGAGISLLGALWGVIAAVAIALGFVLFWPVRRMLKRRRPGDTGRAGEQMQAASGDAAMRDTGRWGC